MNIKTSFFQNGNGKLFGNIRKTSDCTTNDKTCVILESTRRQHSIIRSSHHVCSIKKLAFKIFTKFTGKTPASVFFNNRLATLLTLVKFLRISFLQGTSG